MKALWSSMAMICIGAALLAPPALATHVDCGDVVTASTKLDSDLIDCPGNGLVIGADDITLDLAGHVIDGDAVFGLFEIAISNHDGHDDVVIKDGTVQQFASGLSLFGADRNTLRNLTISASRNGDGIALGRSDGNLIQDNEVLLAEEGIRAVASSDNRIRGNTVRGSEFGFDVFGILGIERAERNQIEDNLVVESLSNGMVVSSDYGIVRKNTVLNSRGGGGLHGGFIVGSRFEKNVVTGNFRNGMLLDTCDQCVVQRNEVTGNGYHGIAITGNGSTILRHNFSASNGWNTFGFDGIHLSTPGHVVKSNIANDNYDLGIEAVAGTIDGGGNKASGNVTAAQCVNVTCK